MCHEKCSGMGGHKTLKALGLLALRVAIGTIFVYQGYGKMFVNHEMASGFLGSVVGPASWGSFWAYFVGGAEVLGGLMIILGVYANVAAIWLSIIMVVAMFTAHPAGAKFNAWFLELAILGGTLALAGNGAGKFRVWKTECCCKKCMGKTDGAKMEGGNGCACGGNCACGIKKMNEPTEAQK